MSKNQNFKFHFTKIQNFDALPLNFPQKICRSSGEV